MRWAGPPEAEPGADAGTFRPQEKAVTVSPVIPMILPGTAAAYSDHVPDQVEEATDRVEPYVAAAVEDPADQVEPHVAAAIVDVFVYVVVLNLFVEYLPKVISETFTLSLLTAVLLKGVLEIVVAAKNWVKARLRAASTPIGKVVAAVMLWAVLFGSKFLVLEVVALVFGDRVSLGGYLLDKFGDEPGGAGRAVGLDIAVADGLANQFSDFGGDEVGFGGGKVHAMAGAVAG